MSNKHAFATGEASSSNYTTYRRALDEGFTSGWVYWNDYREPVTWRKGPQKGQVVVKDRFSIITIVSEDEWVYVDRGKTSTLAPTENYTTAQPTAARDHDEITYPSHYAYSPIQPIDVVESWKLGYHLGTVLKYLCRAGKKTPDILKDLRKAQWFLNRYISRLEKDANEKTRTCDTAK